LVNSAATHVVERSMKAFLRLVCEYTGWSKNKSTNMIVNLTIWDFTYSVLVLLMTNAVVV